MVLAEDCVWTVFGQIKDCDRTGNVLDSHCSTVSVLGSHHVLDALWQWISLPSAAVSIQHSMQNGVQH